MLTPLAPYFSRYLIDHDHVGLSHEIHAEQPINQLQCTHTQLAQLASSLKPVASLYSISDIFMHIRYINVSFVPYYSNIYLQGVPSGYIIYWVLTNTSTTSKSTLARLCLDRLP
jgi:hypothetical protein